MFSMFSDLRSALEEQAVATGRETDDNAHGFPFARERDCLYDLGQLASLLPVLPTEILGKLEKGGLGHQEKPETIIFG